MTEIELIQYLQENFPRENERCEWKEFKSLKHTINGSESNDIISYVSALANMNGGHLVIGVEDKTLSIVGIQDFNKRTASKLKLDILSDCTNLSSEGFHIEELKTSDSNKIVWVFHIPKHPYRLPVYAHKKCWQRVEDSLVAMTKARQDAILAEVRILDDWSAKIVSAASLVDLDPDAIQKARIEFVKRNPSKIEDEKNWDNTKFLDKAKLTINGQITNTALILLGRDESEHFLGSTVKIRWILRSVDDQTKASEIHSIPFILKVDKVFAAIRNLKYTYAKEDTLFTDEMPRYDLFTIREPLHNAIAHQDYSMNGYINVVEYEDDHLVFSNVGKFLPSSIEDVVLKDAPQEIYRNPFLVAAMKNLNMIETEGGGIRKIFNFQRQRLFPMPDYDLGDNRCKITITGKILNLDFARILIKNPGLSLIDIILLDKVQKNKRDLTDEQIVYLRKKLFIEGRKPNFFLSFKVIQPTGNDDLKAEYISNKSFDDQYFRNTILQYLRTHGDTEKFKIEKFIIPKLSPILSDSQKKSKVTNYLTSLRKAGLIESIADYKWRCKI